MAQAANVTAIKSATFKIELGHSPPARHHDAGPYVRAIHDLLKAPVGASFFIPQNGKKSQSVTLRTIASREATARGGRGCLALRQVDGGWRLWKVAETENR